VTDTVIVRFEGAGSGVAELSWGQHEIWQVMADKGDSLPIGGVRALPPGQTVADVAAGLGFVMARHQSLRTRLRLVSGGLPRQVVHASGEIALEVVDAGDGDPAEAAAAVVAGYMTRSFDYERDWPVRMAVITRHGAATHVAEIYCHLAMDGFGLAALRADLARYDLARSDRTGPEPAPVTAMQPLEQARRQRSPAGRRAHDASMRHFERVAASAPDRQFSEQADKQQPRFWQVIYESRAGYLAARTLAARLGVSTSSVLLAACAAALSALTSTPSVAVSLVVNNRFRPGFADSVSTLAQSFPCLIEVGDARFDEVCVRAWRAALVAYKHAYYDLAGKDEVCRRIAAERGAEPALGVFFNDLRIRSRELADSVSGDAAAPAEPPSLRAELARSTLTWGERNDVPADPLFLYINDVPDTLCYELWADSHFVSPPDMAALMRRIEAVLVDAAVPAMDALR